MKSFYIILDVCLSIWKYAAVGNNIIKKKFCETQLRLEGQSSTPTFNFTHILFDDYFKQGLNRLKIHYQINIAIESQQL